MVRDVAVDGGVVTVTIALTTSGCPLRAQIQKDIRTRVGSMPGVDQVKLAWDEMNQDEKATAMERARFNISQRSEDSSVGPTTKVILVSSGKGGVGKSSVTVNLAAAMAARGLKVGRARRRHLGLLGAPPARRRRVDSSSTRDRRQEVHGPQRARRSATACSG